jgi:predicted nucleotidyltransferase
MDARVQRALKEFRDGVASIFGDRLARVVLFGSRARGDARPDSDVDVLLVLRVRRTESEADLVAALESDISIAYGLVIAAVYVSLDEYELGRLGLVRNAVREGVAL